MEQMCAHEKNKQISLISKDIVAEIFIGMESTRTFFTKSNYMNIKDFLTDTNVLLLFILIKSTPVSLLWL